MAKTINPKPQGKANPGSNLGKYLHPTKAR